MTITAFRKLSSSRNGVSSFILPCTKLDFHYCDWAGSSKGMNIFLRTLLPQFAKAHPSIEISVSPKPHKHPVIIGHYINGREKAVCVKNLAREQILQKAELLRNASGDKLRRTRKAVQSDNKSVRGIWSPHHGWGRETKDRVFEKKGKV